MDLVQRSARTWDGVVAGAGDSLVAYTRVSFTITTTLGYPSACPVRQTVRPLSSARARICSTAGALPATTEWCVPDMQTGRSRKISSVTTCVPGWRRIAPQSSQRRTASANAPSRGGTRRLRSRSSTPSTRPHVWRLTLRRRRRDSVSRHTSTVMSSSSPRRVSMRETRACHVRALSLTPFEPRVRACVFLCFTP